MKIHINFESVIYLIFGGYFFSHLTDKHFTKKFNPNILYIQLFQKNMFINKI